MKQPIVNIDPYPITRIEPPNNKINLGLHELWEYGDLIWLLVVREIKVRYKQTIIGGTWAIIQPLLTMVVFTILFDKLAKLPSDDIPYPVFSFCALVPWTYFTHALTKSSTSLVYDRALLTKVYFPRLIIPIAAVLGGLMDFFISFLMLLLLLGWYGIVPNSSIIFLPFFILLIILTALAVGLWLSAINVEYRDVSNMLPFLVQIWLFITPIAYSSTLIPEKWQFLYGLNPMAGVIEGFRWTLLNKEMPAFSLMLVSSLMTLCLLIGGLYFFKRREDYFTDVI
ncbi:MAG: ABC transporter permease [Bacteroidota bacterium]